MRRFRLAPGHAKPIFAGHPWIHAAALRPLPPSDTPSAPDVVEIVTTDDRRVGRGFLSPDSAIRVRLFETTTPDADPDDLLRDRIRQAAALRHRLFPDPSATNAYRLVHAEGDGLPGLVVDRYGPLLVAQFATGPMHARRAALADALLEHTQATSLIARPGGYEREEGIPDEEVPFVRGEAAPKSLWVREAGVDVEVESAGGQKTGHYVDQRENRCLVAEAAAGRSVLDVYAGTGLFSVHALRRGASSALAIDASEPAIRRAQRHAERNGVAEGLEAQAADAKDALQALKAEERRFGLVVVDPPNFFPRRGGEGRAQRAYRDLNVQALTRVEPGGLMATFSCSARLDPEGLRQVVVAAARECRRPVRVLRELAAGPDHPYPAAAPEGRYLTGLLVGLQP